MAFFLASIAVLLPSLRYIAPTWSVPRTVRLSTIIASQGDDEHLLHMEKLADLLVANYVELDKAREAVREAKAEADTAMKNAGGFSAEIELARSEAQLARAEAQAVMAKLKAANAERQQAAAQLDAAMAERAAARAELETANKNIEVIQSELDEVRAAGLNEALRSEQRVQMTWSSPSVNGLIVAPPPTAEHHVVAWSFYAQFRRGQEIARPHLIHQVRRCVTQGQLAVHSPNEQFNNLALTDEVYPRMLYRTPIPSRGEAAKLDDAASELMTLAHRMSSKKQASEPQSSN